MKIYVDKITEEGLELDEEINSNKISEDLEREDICFDKPISVSAKVTKKSREVFVDISLETLVEYSCDTCLKKFEKVFKKEFNLNYNTQSGDVLDIDEDIRQEVILSCPMKIICSDDCKGLCANCGQNLNVGTCDCK